MRARAPHRVAAGFTAVLAMLSVSDAIAQSAGATTEGAKPPSVGTLPGGEPVSDLTAPGQGGVAGTGLGGTKRAAGAAGTGASATGSAGQGIGGQGAGGLDTKAIPGITDPQ